MALIENCRTYQTPKDSGCAQSCSSDVIELNVGGQVYYTRHATLTSVPNSLLGKLFSTKKDISNDLVQDIKGRYFIDRDGFLFRYVLDYLRDKNVVLPDYFPEKGRLKREAEFFQLPELVKILTPDDYIHNDLDEASLGSDQRLFPASYLTRAIGATASSRWDTRARAPSGGTLIQKLEEYPKSLFAEGSVWLKKFLGTR